MRLKEFAHGFDLGGSVDRFFRKGSFGKDEEQNYRPGQTITRSELPRPIGFFGRLATYALLFLALYIYFEPKDLSHTPLDCSTISLSP